MTIEFGDGPPYSKLAHVSNDKLEEAIKLIRAEQQERKLAAEKALKRQQLITVMITAERGALEDLQILLGHNVGVPTTAFTAVSKHHSEHPDVCDVFSRWARNIEHFSGIFYQLTAALKKH